MHLGCLGFKRLVRAVAVRNARVLAWFMLCLCDIALTNLNSLVLWLLAASADAALCFPHDTMCLAMGIEFS